MRKRLHREDGAAAPNARAERCERVANIGAHDSTDETLPMIRVPSSANGPGIVRAIEGGRVDCPYFGISQQRDLILNRLRTGAATVREIESELHVRDATARIHELRAQGHRIETKWTDEVNPDGSRSRVGLYVLMQANDPQFLLFPRK